MGFQENAQTDGRTDGRTEPTLKDPSGYHSGSKIGNGKHGKIFFGQSNSKLIQGPSIYA